jgi:putative glutamine amidotransferase
MMECTSSMQKPIIGIPCFAMVRADTGRPIYASNQAYARAVAHAGGIPVLIPSLADLPDASAIAGWMDGLLLAGGSDLDPSLYGEAPVPESSASDPERDRLELALVRLALDQDLPIFGVCRGLQVLNVARGGSLYQHVPAERPSNIDHEQAGQPKRTHIAHGISVEPGSRLASILGDELTVTGVNSFHHQAAKRLGEGLKVTAVAEDGIIEAVEMADSPFVLAVQYHPEELVVSDSGSRRLFSAFVQASAGHKGARA